ncbi:alpha/beta fold hydrolase [Parvularcula marina]|uniref:alpha/beta fold hydrolase n=1 Tax=Parvularcula marina TaxID=2292771 RepID=UPI00351581DE
MTFSVCPGPVIPVGSCVKAASSFVHGGHQYACWQAGEGPDLLLIHGFPTSSWDWAALWGPLSWHFRLHAMDMLGFGLSDKPRGHRYLIADQAEAYAALLRARGVNEVHLLVHDYGCTVGQELLARAAEGSLEGITIKSIVFLNGGLFPHAHRPRPIQKLMAGPLGPLIARFMSRRSFGKSFSAIFGPNTQPTDEELDAYWSLICTEDGVKVIPALLDYMAQRRANEARWTDPIKTPAVPMRLINGLEDPVSGRHLLEEFARLIPDADVVPLEGVGHYPQVEAPREVFREVMDFHRTL